MKINKKVKPVESSPDFPKLEEQLLEHWYKSKIVDKYLKRNEASKKYFSFFDGPITANNPMGVHHGWGRTYKDLWQRYHNMQGYKQRFQNGFDCQGLWVEVEVEKELGFKSKKDIEKYGVAKFVQQCKNRVKKFSAIQTEQSKRLGYFMDWNNSYFTMSDDNNYMIWHFIKVCHENDWLYKGNESVPWCPRCETAISQHEMLTEDYKEVAHDSVYLRLQLAEYPDQYLVIWTTTPWTIPANIAVAVDAKLNYSLIEDQDGINQWVAEGAIDRVFKDGYRKIIKTVKGKDLVGLTYHGPFDELPAVKKVADENSKNFHCVVASDTRILPISESEGTGLVHTAVSAGTEDFKLGKKLGLPMIPVIADNADYLPGLGFLTGRNAKNNPEIIIDYLISQSEKSDKKWVLRIEKTTHRYPACWRCKTELVWKVTEEWYIAMDKGTPSLRERMKKVTKKIKWMPGFGLDRELDWLNSMHDWLISKKNRYWGLCLPIWECEACDNFQVIGSREELQELAIEGWEQFEGKSPHKPYIDSVKINCKKCGKTMSRIEPVGNPWLDAGIVPFSTISKDNKSGPLYKIDKDEWRKWFPADFITESFPGQFKNWFYSLIAMSTVLENSNPFKRVLGFGTLLGEDGRPMHKSWGNALDFHDGAGRIGVDVMRWMYAKQDPSQNLLFGYQNANMVRRQFHLILWNSYRFVVNNLIVDKPKLTKKSKLHILDQWMLSRLNQTIDSVEESLNKYDTSLSTRHIEELVNDFSTWYIRRSRERVGPSSKDDEQKNSFYQTALEFLISLSKMLAPFIPYLSDYIFVNLTGEESVHLSDWPKSNPKYINNELEEKMKLIREIVEAGHAERKKVQIKVRQPLKRMTVRGIKLKLDDELLNLIKDEINVKEITVNKTGDQLMVELDTTISSKLREEGLARELVRKIQTERKKMGLGANDYIHVTVPDLPQKFKQYIAEKTLSKTLQSGKEFVIKRI